MTESSFFVHPLAEVEEHVQIGDKTRIWRHAHIRSYASIGAECNIGKGVYVETHVRIGSRVKIQNNASLFEGVSIEDGVFIGPHVCFTNDMYPRAITPDGRLKGAEDWEVTPTLVKYGASIGAGAVIVCGVTIGEFALIGAGSVVTRDVPPHTLVLGNPARPRGYVCRCARPLREIRESEAGRIGHCERCGDITF
ncbi:acetyltransferase-like isoleucine patch superfamily enzyme [Thermosporothrix hazakensis]|jgi:acetyltransferase-like isoleucine patch superfamily enzyme|uniref:Acetyltransferase-like isoleucine patch superfamily enzyme n=2 Tax=Thermosporothrix TaxID=768650 RepID=A0A326UU48_THEHA|nr:acyltransferase [Thermosporothrix hazakensis]PZW36143.1 acetyltransferase-like isoleucine patch superfamily enzyme [Thermosporothrix hazakensis]BBH88608.1 N-acetyltransferase [Thermosporothrix sp. COM3]GCE46793.1 N-acetyltransferase [Thermosporothrix hazakensis]